MLSLSGFNGEVVGDGGNGGVKVSAFWWMLSFMKVKKKQPRGRKILVESSRKERVYRVF
ncbi:hypothetical protein Hanom_Chr11g00993561 [Helianthus anomalus]